MLRARLLYFCRLLNSRHTFLIALLSSRSAAGAVIMTWTLQLHRDLITLFNASPRLRAEINRIESLHVCGPPCSLFCQHKLFSIVTTMPKYFDKCVHELSFVSSSLDSVALCYFDIPSAFKCEACSLSFACSRALHMHCMKLHAIRSIFRYYADADGVCPICSSDFLTRLRLISHLSDPRRTKCSVHLHLVTKLTEARVEELDQHDRYLKQASKKQGHSHVLAVGQATSASGRLLGKPSL